MLSPARLVASCLGSGLLRPAPGTIGSAFGLVVFALLLAGQSLVVQIAAIVVATALGTWAATAAARELGDGDPSEVVIDELAGMWIALLVARTPAGYAVAFFAFRAFDIVKPFPVRNAESLPEGWGIMADDLVAGLYALGIVWLFEGWFAG